MTERAKAVSLALSCLLAGAAMVGLGGCSANPDGGWDGNLSFTIAGKTITLTLGGAGLFQVSVGTRDTKIADAENFLGGTPSDQPASAVVRLRSTNVTLRESATGKAAVAAQTATRTANLEVSIDVPGAVDPCTTGVSLGTFDIQVSPTGVITVVDEELAITLSAISLFLENNISMCLEMEADFEGTIEVSGLDVVFGPAADDSGNDNSTVGDGLTATFVLTDLAPSRIHIIGPDDEADSTNVLTPGAYKYDRYEDLSYSDLLTFSAVTCPNFDDLIGGPDAEFSAVGVCPTPEVLDTATCPPIDQSDFWANVDWDGTTLTCYQSTPTSAPSIPAQACCGPDGACEMSMESDCYNMYDFHGTPMGVGSTCDPNTCPTEQPDQRWCCQARYATLTQEYGEFCSPEDPEWCLAGYGTLIDASECDENGRCDEDFIACCNPSSDECSDTLFDKCIEMGWDPKPFGVHCDYDKCPSDDEACCFDDGQCVNTDPNTCTLNGGTPGGAGTECGPLECVGACCKADNCCYQLSLDNCEAAGGTYQGFAVDCGSGVCPERYTCYRIANFPYKDYLTVQPACSVGSVVSLHTFPGGDAGLPMPADFVDDLLPGQSFATREEAAAACCVGLTNFSVEGTSVVATRNGSETGLDQIILDECEEPGACCNGRGDCTEASKTDCADLDDSVLGPTSFEGPGTSCASTTCSAASPTKWVLVDTITNSAGASTVVTGTDRYEGSVTTYTITPTSISMTAVRVESGVEEYNATLTSTFDGPPQELSPGDVIVLPVEFSHSGWANTDLGAGPAIRFEHRGDGIPRTDGSDSYFYGPWADGFTGENTWTNEFTVPAVGSGQITIYAFWWNCTPCDVIWVYEAQ